MVWQHRVSSGSNCLNDAPPLWESLTCSQPRRFHFGRWWLHFHFPFIHKELNRERRQPCGWSPSPASLENACNGSRCHQNHKTLACRRCSYTALTLSRPPPHSRVTRTSSEEVEQFYIVQLSRRSEIKCIGDTWLLWLTLNSCHHSTLVEISKCSQRCHCHSLKKK